MWSLRHPARRRIGMPIACAVVAWCAACSTPRVPDSSGPSASASSSAPPAPDDDPLMTLLHEPGQAAPPPLEPQAAHVVLTALAFIDTPYRAGGTQTGGFDCSGFTRHVFAASAGIALPRSAAEQAADPQLDSIRRDQLQPGDLVFFNTLRRRWSHVGIYIGDNRFVHAPRTGSQVRLEDMRLPYWDRRFDGARRAHLPPQ